VELIKNNGKLKTLEEGETEDLFKYIVRMTQTSKKNKKEQMKSKKWEVRKMLKY